MNLGSMKRRMQSVLFRMPLMITCREFEEFIVEYLEGGLTEQQRRVFEIHLRVCRECREYLAAYKAGIEAARQGLAEPAGPKIDDAPDDLVKAILASIEVGVSDNNPPESS